MDVNADFSKRVVMHGDWIDDGSIESTRKMNV